LVEKRLSHSGRLFKVAEGDLLLSLAQIDQIGRRGHQHACSCSRAPEDLKRTPLNPAPNPKQIEPDERVERIRRIHLNDLENLPFFLAAGFLYVLTQPSLLLAQVLLYGYVVSRLLHFAAYLTARTHDVRATLWTVGSLILIFMTCRTLLAAIGY